MENGNSQRQKNVSFLSEKRTKALKRKRIPDIINLQEMKRMNDLYERNGKRSLIGSDDLGADHSNNRSIF